MEDGQIWDGHCHRFQILTGFYKKWFFLRTKLVYLRLNIRCKSKALNLRQPKLSASCRGSVFRENFWVSDAYFLNLRVVEFSKFLRKGWAVGIALKKEVVSLIFIITNPCQCYLSALEITFLNPWGHCDQIILLFGSHFKFRVVSWYMPEILSAIMVGRQRKFCNLDCLKQPFQQFFIIFYSKI